MNKKRPVGSQRGSTPGKPSNKAARKACNSRSRNSLSFGNEVVKLRRFLREKCRLR